jgi:hypothetical protein
MRKLTLLATTAIAALAMAAAAAPAANADRAFTMVHPASGGLSCNPCWDTGYAGSIDFKNTYTGAWQGACDVQFDVRFQSNGSLETYNNLINNCTPAGMYPCDDSWAGQLRVPDTGPAKIDLQICLENPSTGQEINHDITLTAYNNPRRWEQATEDNDSSYTVINSYFEDGYSADNAAVQLL